MFELQADLNVLEEQGLYRRRLVSQSPQDVVATINGREVISFCSNDYLGLANHPAIRQVVIDAVHNYGVGSGAAHLINGHSILHHECEARLAEITGRDRALLFSTGYMANLALASALLGRKDVIVQDRLNHASLIDSAHLSGARLLRFHHNDLAQAQRILEQQVKPSRRVLVMSDAVFSMDGDVADVPALAQLCQQDGCELMIDDAHGFGVLGATGAGTCEQYGLDQQQVPILMATLGKAVGVSGAFVAGREALIETLIQRARSYIYTTASPPALAAAIMKSLDIISTETWRRDKLLQSIDYFKQRVQGLDCELMPSATAIQPIVIGDNDRTLTISRALFERGLHVVAIRPPTVPQNSARLRITLSAAHEKPHIDQLVKALVELL